MARWATTREERALEELLVLRCQARDRAALDLLVERWHPRLLRLVRRLTQEHDVDEVVQEIWLSIVRGLQGLRDPAHFASWAYRLASNKCVDWIRGRQRDRGLGRQMAEQPLAVLSRAGVISEAEPQQDETTLGTMRAGLAELSAAHRTVLEMHYLDELPLAHIAKALDVPRGTIKSRLFHARKRLREHLEDSS